MKINIRSFLTMRDVMGGQSALKLEIGSLTVMELLHGLSDMFGERFSQMVFDKSGKDLNPHVRILINGRHYSHMPQKLNTLLRDGDEISLFPPVMGG